MRHLDGRFALVDQSWLSANMRATFWTLAMIYGCTTCPRQSLPVTDEFSFVNRGGCDLGHLVDMKRIQKSNCQCNGILNMSPNPANGCFAWVVQTGLKGMDDWRMAQRKGTLPLFQSLSSISSSRQLFPSRFSCNSTFRNCPSFLSSSFLFPSAET